MPDDLKTLTTWEWWLSSNHRKGNGDKMKTNHSRSFTARKDHGPGYKLRGGFKDASNRAFRASTRNAIARALGTGGDIDNTCLPSKRYHGENPWNWD